MGDRNDDELLARVAELEREHRKVEAALRDSERRYENLLDNALEGIGYSQGNRIVFANRAFLDMLGYDSLEECQTRSLLDLVAPESRAFVEDRLRRRALGETLSATYEYKILRKDGTSRDVEIWTVPVTMNGEQYVQSTFRDITARKRAENALLDSRALLLAAFDDSPLLMSISDLSTGKYVEVNASFCRTSGFSRDEVIGKTSVELGWLAGEERARLLEELLRTGRVADLELPLRRKDGRAVVCRYWGDVLRTADGDRLLSTAEDITERKRAEEALRETERHLRSVIAATPIALWDLDRDGTIRLSEGEALKHLGTRPSERVGRSAFEVYGHAPEALALIRRGLAGEEFSAEISLAGRHWSNQYIPRRDGRGEVVGLIGVSTDVTERKRGEEERRELQAKLAHAQKMEAVGQLAGGIAHDFNNILAAMTLQLDLVRLRPNVTPDELSSAVAELLESASRATDLTRQLLLFARRQALRTARHDVNAIVEDLATLLRRLLGEHVSLVVERCTDPLWFEGDAGMIEQVVTNLCVNARDAMPKGGRLTITTAPVVLDVQATQRHGAAQPGRFVRLQVADTGCGIEPAVLDHIFEPFFTTKPQGKGTGLGLATVHGIVAKHGGFVEVNSQVGSGTTFSVYLPSASAADASERPSGPSGLRGGSERILVVEDEAAVRRMAVLCLRQLGYRVAEAATGLDALRVWEQEGGKFDLLFTDMVMPEGLSGLDLCARLRQAAPDLRTIIASGYSAEIVDDENVAKHEVSYLSKPYDVGTLAAAVRECLEGKS